MDIIINDKSLDGQFSSVDDFLDSVFEYTLPLLELIDEKKMRLLKSQSTYSRNVTCNSTLVELFRINSNNTELTMLKRELVAKLCDEPFWEDDSQTCLKSHYYYNEDLEKPSSITEVVERKGILLSFMHNLFKDDFLHIEKDMELCRVRNAYKKEQMLKHFIEKKVISGMEYLQFSKFQMEIVFCELEQVCHIRNLFDENEFEISDYIKVKDNIEHMIDCILEGKSCRFTKDMKVQNVSLFEFRTTVSASRELRMFYVYQNQKIVFLNGCIKKSEKTPKNDLQLAIKLAKHIIG